MYIYIYIYIYTYIHTYTHTHDITNTIPTIIIHMNHIYTIIWLCCIIHVLCNTLYIYIYIHICINSMPSYIIIYHVMPCSRLGRADISYQ